MAVSQADGDAATLLSGAPDGSPARGAAAAAADGYALGPCAAHWGARSALGAAARGGRPAPPRRAASAALAVLYWTVLFAMGAAMGGLSSVLPVLRRAIEAVRAPAPLPREPPRARVRLCVWGARVGLAADARARARRDAPTAGCGCACVIQTQASHTSSRERGDSCLRAGGSRRWSRRRIALLALRGPARGLRGGRPGHRRHPRVCACCVCVCVCVCGCGCGCVCVGVYVCVCCVCVRVCVCACV